MSDPNDLPVKTRQPDLQGPEQNAEEHAGAKVPDGPREASEIHPAPVAESRENLPPGSPDEHLEPTDKPQAQSAAIETEPSSERKEIPSPADPEDEEDDEDEDTDEDTNEDTDTDDVPTRQLPSRDEADAAVLAASRRHTRRAFALSAAAAAVGYGFYRWIDGSPGAGMQPQPLRELFQANAAIARALTHEHPLAPTYSQKEARDLRVNGVYGLKKALVSDSWRLQLVGTQDAALHPRFSPDVTAWEYRYEDAKTGEDRGHDTKVDPNARTAEKMAPEEMLKTAKSQEEHAGRMPRGTEEAGMSYSTLRPQTPGLLLTMQDLLTLPRHELVTQFKCIEGWSEIVQWAGVRLADLLEAYPPQSIDGHDPLYIYMETPDGDYYTGYDLDACRHPQALLVTEMMGAPLTQFHGAPLRLHMPTKYGYKQIKRIGLIRYTNTKPDDYWTKLGYDWYAGL